jgi:hypothetical protein
VTELVFCRKQVLSDIIDEVIRYRENMLLLFIIFMVSRTNTLVTSSR